MAGDPPSLYEWGGGRAAFERWLNAFYDLIEADELIAPLFGGTVTEMHPGPLGLLVLLVLLVLVVLAALATT